ncbi:MAG: glycosyltransferase family 39 protein [Anaerolineae bacterium]|nr:glycosyltransferase family 39 protein [Anaerolineae bacterium]
MMIVLLVTALLRFAALPELPLGLHYDEAANLVLTRQIVEDQYRPLFIRAYTGKEVFFFYAAAPWVWMVGGSAWGLRLGGAVVGVLTVAATYAATRALVGRRRGGPAIALFAAGWMAVAFPHVLLSRYGFRAISQPLLQALTVAMLWRGLRFRRMGWSVGAGALLGLTGYTYLAARLFPLPLALTGGWLVARSNSSERWHTLRRFALVLGIAAIVFAPLGLYFLRHPDAFTTRISQVGIPSRPCWRWWAWGRCSGAVARTVLRQRDAGSCLWRSS